ncbi:S-adenosyl-L-methionine-dependent methyltransferase [Aspergillus ambiguus]|uniref:tRNA (adenine-N(1)-)-methyltransferase n=1 Tax=Aspergillus ambiguus TaxID=176160 RepID=UPI003CCD4378
MARLLQSLRRVLGLSPSCKPSPPSIFPRSVDTDFSFFREGDRAVIHGKTPTLTKPLRHGHKTDLRRGSLPHDSIIGQRVRDRIQAVKGPECRLTLPTLDEYVALTPRLVTPIYAADANLIVSLLDIHVAPPADGDDRTRPPPLEILESGTGHGSLTLHLARAIQAANPTPPPLPTRSQVQFLQDRPIRPDEEDRSTTSPQTTTTSTPDNAPPPETADAAQQQTWDAWRAQRRAVIHTVDVSPKFSAHAEKIVRGFRRGLYAGNVDFYVGHVENWIVQQTAARQRAQPSLLSRTPTAASVEPFLSYAILDMPSAHQRIPRVAPILKRDGVLAVFMPSITQIGDCVDLIRQQALPFALEKVVELGAGISSGRLWDVRFAVKKSRADPSSWAETAEGESAAAADGATGETPAMEEAKADDSVLVCRPKVGSRIVGGGFVGIWRRIEDLQKR